MTAPDHIVYVVDDDPRVREAVIELLSSAGRNAVAFGSVAEYLMQPGPDLPGCLVLDVNMPDLNGLDFQKQLAATDHVPIVFITGHGDIPTSVRAIKAGALDFLTKPFSDEALLQVVPAAIQQDRKALQKRPHLAQLRAPYASPTPRGGEVLPPGVAGLLTTQGAADRGIRQH